MGDSLEKKSAPASFDRSNINDLQEEFDTLSREGIPSESIVEMLLRKGYPIEYVQEFLKVNSPRP